MEIDEKAVSSDELYNIQIQLEDLFKSFSESTDFILSYCQPKPAINEPDMAGSQINLNRIQFENLEDSKLNSFNQTMTEYSAKINAMFEKLEETINQVPNKEEYLKSEDDLKKEILAIKKHKQAQVDSLNSSLKLAQETLDIFEEYQKLDMFNGN